MGSAASLPLAALAQQPAEMKRLAMVHPSDLSAHLFQATIDLTVRSSTS
jgi:hypothetical protein